MTAICVHFSNSRRSTSLQNDQNSAHGALILPFRPCPSKYLVAPPAKNSLMEKKQGRWKKLSTFILKSLWKNHFAYFTKVTKHWKRTVNRSHRIYNVDINDDVLEYIPGRMEAVVHNFALSKAGITRQVKTSCLERVQQNNSSCKTSRMNDFLVARASVPTLSSFYSKTPPRPFSLLQNISLWWYKRCSTTLNYNWD